MSAHRGPSSRTSSPKYQGLLDRMIAVDPRNRFKRADEVLEAIDDVWTQQALRALKRGS